MDNRMQTMRISYSLADIEQAVDRFWQYAHTYRVIDFRGDLGAGKTTFVKALCKYLGTKQTVHSPTFSLINEYAFLLPDGSEKIIYHSDWYRLDDENEAIAAGIEDMLANESAYCFIEWGEKLPGLLPPGHLRVDLEMKGPYERDLVVSSPPLVENR